MGIRWLIVGLLVLAVTAALPSLLAQPAIQWRESFEEAVHEALRMHKPLFVYFYSDTCPYCVQMESTTFRNRDVVEILNAQYVPVRLNIRGNEEIARMYGVPGTPTVVFAYPNGTPIKVLVGYRDSEVILALAEAILKMYGRKFGTPVNATNVSSSARGALSPLVAAALSMPLVFAAGVVSAFSPCVLPLIPVVIAGQRKARGASLAALNLGFIATYTALGLIAGVVGAGLAPVSPWLTKVACVVVIAMGLIMLFDVLKVTMSRFSSRIASAAGRRQWVGITGSLLLGVFVALAWTPCVGPLVGAMLTYAIAAGSAYLGAAVGAVYASGFAATMYVLSRVIAKLGSRERAVRKFGRRRRKSRLAPLARYGRLAEKAAGAAMVLLGLASLLGIL